MNDSLIRCDNCKREERVDFARCLATGWPRCNCTGDRYGYTMRLVETKADVGAATTAVLKAQSSR